MAVGNQPGQHGIDGHRPVLARARAVYLGDEEERWDDLQPQARAYVKHVAAEIERLRSDPRVS